MNALKDAIKPRLVVTKLPAVLTQTGLSSSTIYRKVKDGSFPSPIKTGEAAAGWLQHEDDEWLEARMSERDEAQQAPHEVPSDSSQTPATGSRSDHCLQGPNSECVEAVRSNARRAHVWTEREQQGASTKTSITTYDMYNRLPQSNYEGQPKPSNPLLSPAYKNKQETY
jgi:prophage regulatory protein